MEVVHSTGLREAKKAATRSALARAVLRLSTRAGIDHVTIDAVAAEANVSVRTFHNYFSGKEDALLYFVSSLFDTIVERIEARPTDESFYCSVRTALIDAATSPDVGDPVEIVALLRLLDTDPGLTARSRDMELGDTVEARLAELCAQRGQPAHTLYPRLVLHNAITTIRVALEFWVTHHDDTADEPADLASVLESAFDQLASGLSQPIPPMNDLAVPSPEEL
ncbi:TetR family transcriptional regulator [Gordonia McavH-238-E]|uniref:TetR/AcrR family transcriptional regulator n=1 Tax=Gordonia sp. McavH-238-E TaxID=2917736 RepID=UPI001EF74006|nr:TetR family transcriptional regulator [Gordonia sp. McavH-238-E]MCG7632167.1 TetR family transcriptional regulator [Gordonia sp. McavH-238-E]